MGERGETGEESETESDIPCTKDRESESEGDSPGSPKLMHSLALPLQHMF